MMVDEAQFGKPPCQVGVIIQELPKGALTLDPKYYNSFHVLSIPYRILHDDQRPRGSGGIVLRILGNPLRRKPTSAEGVTTTCPWLDGNEGVDKKMEATRLGYEGITIRIPF